MRQSATRATSAPVGRNGRSLANILETIGGTPLVELTHIELPQDVHLYAKLEGFNPSGSLKDRIAKYMIETAERRGELAPGATILEATSGNTGISLAMFARLKGYNLVAVIPEDVSPERIELLRSYGAEVVLSDAQQGTNGAIRQAKEMAQQAQAGRYWLPDQYSNQANVQAHYETTGAEIAQVLFDVDVLVAGLGTGGTLMGVGRRLRETNPGLRVVAVQPYPGGGIQGLRSLADGFVPSIVDLSLLDESRIVADLDAFRGTQELLAAEGVFGGISSGAVLAVAKAIAGSMKRGNIVAVMADSGWKYLSSGLWTANPEEVRTRLTGPLW